MKIQGFGVVRIGSTGRERKQCENSYIIKKMAVFCNKERRETGVEGERGEE